MIPTPYSGKENYIFISYSHRDTDQVFPVIEELTANGYRVWFDQGIDPGTEWDENIAEHIEHCGYFLAFMSKNYLGSNNCKDELNYARDLEKERLIVYLEEVELPGGMAMRLNRIQSIFKYTYKKDAEFYAKLFTANNLDSCLGAAGTEETPVAEEPAKTEELPPAEESPKKNEPAKWDWSTRLFTPSKPTVPKPAGNIKKNDSLNAEEKAESNSEIMLLLVSTALFVVEMIMLIFGITFGYLFPLLIGMLIVSGVSMVLCVIAGIKPKEKLPMNIANIIMFIGSLLTFCNSMYYLFTFNELP